MGTILDVFQEIVIVDLRPAGENVGTVFLEVGTARTKTLRPECCSMCLRNWRAGSRAGVEYTRERRGGECLNI